MVKNRLRYFALTIAIGLVWPSCVLAGDLRGYFIRTYEGAPKPLREVSIVLHGYYEVTIIEIVSHESNSVVYANDTYSPPDPNKCDWASKELELHPEWGEKQVVPKYIELLPGTYSILFDATHKMYDNRCGGRSFNTITHECRNILTKEKVPGTTVTTTSTKRGIEETITLMPGHLVSVRSWGAISDNKKLKGFYNRKGRRTFKRDRREFDCTLRNDTLVKSGN